MFWYCWYFQRTNFSVNVFINITFLLSLLLISALIWITYFLHLYFGSLFLFYFFKRELQIIDLRPFFLFWDGHLKLLIFLSCIPLTLICVFLFSFNFKIFPNFLCYVFLIHGLFRSVFKFPNTWGFIIPQLLLTSNFYFIVLRNILCMILILLHKKL